MSVLHKYTTNCRVFNYRHHTDKEKYLPLPIRFRCEIATQGYEMKDGIISEKEKGDSPQYHFKQFNYDCVDQFQWLIDRLNEKGDFVDEAIVEFSNSWGHLLYAPSNRFPGEERLGDDAGQPQNKTIMFGMDYRMLVRTVEDQLRTENSPLIGGSVALEYCRIEGKVVPCAVPANLLWSLFYEYRTNPPKEYFTCKFYRENGKRSRPRRGIDPVTKQTRKCPVGCRVLRTHPKQKWGEGCRKAWEKRKERESKSNT